MNKFLFSIRPLMAVILITVSALACSSSSAATQPAPAQDAPATTDSAPASTKASAATDSAPAATEAPIAEPPVSVNTGLEGSYNINGTNLDGSTYEGELTIELNNTDNSSSTEIYDLDWNNSTVVGAGILVENMLAASYGGDACGAVFYAIDSDMNLAGLWLTLNSRELGAEDATPTTERSTLEGDYTLEGTNPNGSTYSGTLSMIEQGDVWQMIWETESTDDGIGISMEDELLAGAYGGDDCGVVIYTINDDGSLEGIWGIWGENQSGTENGTKQ